MKLLIKLMTLVINCAVCGLKCAFDRVVFGRILMALFTFYRAGHVGGHFHDIIHISRAKTMIALCLSV